MRVVLTGSSGRIGRAIFGALAPEHTVVGIDRTPFSTSHVVSDFADRDMLARVMAGADAVIHTAALHAPHVGTVDDREFQRVNVDGTRVLAEAALECGVPRFVFTSTTALYARAIARGKCTLIDEQTPPQPSSVYHRTKLAAENLLATLAGGGFAVRVLRMSRCFPEPADVMAAYRLHRGVDARDVAHAHARALANGGAAFQCQIISAATPFAATDCDALASDAPGVLRARAPELVEEFRLRGWRLPRSIDRIYLSKAAERELGWTPRYGFREVIAQLERSSLEVLPPGITTLKRAE